MPDAMFYSLARLLKQVKRRRQLGVLLVVFVLVFSILGNTLSFFFFDRSAWPNLTIWDSLWYSIVSITTIGYGDMAARTVGARIGTGVFIIMFGLVALPAALGMIVDWIVEVRHKERRGMGTQRTKDHLLIVNFPNEGRIRQIIDEFCRDDQHRNYEIIVVTDQIEELPFSLTTVSFVKGSPLAQETFLRADVANARQAIVLSPSYDDPRSDSLVGSVSFLIEHLNPNISIIAECLDPKHAILFNVSPRVSLVYTMQVANNLLVQEAQDPGVNLLTQAITSNVVDIEETLASTIVSTTPLDNYPYTEMAKKLLDHGVVLVGVIRDGDVLVGFEDVSLSERDSVVYISKIRHEWGTLASMIE